MQKCDTGLKLVNLPQGVVLTGLFFKIALRTMFFYLPAVDKGKNIVKHRLNSGEVALSNQRC